jgi:hypothetical protein
MHYWSRVIHSSQWQHLTIPTSFIENLSVLALLHISAREEQFIITSSYSTRFRRVRKIAKSEYFLRHVRPSVCLSVWNNSAPTEMISIKFDIRDFFEKLARKLECN